MLWDIGIFREKDKVLLSAQVIDVPFDDPNPLWVIHYFINSWKRLPEHRILDNSISIRATRRFRPQMQIKPLDDRVAIEPIDDTQKMYHKILWIPETAKEKPHKGIVVAVGPGKYIDGERRKIFCSIGDLVLYGQYVGQEVVVEEKKLLIVKESDILCVIEKGDNA